MADETAPTPAPGSDDGGDEPTPAKSPLSKAERIEKEREEILAGLASAKLDKLQEKVAWVLNRYPKARDSDLALQIHYWEEFEPELGGGASIAKEDLYKLTRLTSLTRARAKIQNDYQLFQASAAVRSARGTLSEEERAKAAEQQIDFPIFDVYMDESGKNSKHLIVGSVWCLHAPELLRFHKDVASWRIARGFKDELHFKNINDKNLEHYLGFADELAARAGVFSFKALSVEKAGVKNVDDALREMFFHLLVRGIEHEHDTGRAPLPRSLQVWKDLEEPGKDKLFLAALKERALAAAAARFGDNLGAEEFVAVDSKGNTLIQVADLFTASINRVLNAEGARTGAKDQFADYLLQLVGLSEGPSAKETLGDMALHISL